MRRGLLAALRGLPWAAQAAAADAILGSWLTDDGASRVEITPRPTRQSRLAPKVKAGLLTKTDYWPR